jgi:hypothetical protein
MSEQKCNKMSELEDTAIDMLLSALKGNRDVDEEVKVAMKALNVVAKNRMTLSHRRGLDFAMARITMTDDELKKYAQVTTPEIKKLLKAS